MVAKMRKGVPAALVPLFWIGAGNEARTRDLNLGKVALYQLSYSRILTFTARARGPDSQTSGGAVRSRTGLTGFAIRGITALLPRQRVFGAGNEARTRDLNLGKVALYQLSYSRKNFRRHNHRKTQPLR